MDDFTFIQRFRELLRDKPRFYNETATGDGTTVQITLQRAPINDDEFFQVAVGGTVVPWTASWPPPATPEQVYVDFDTGELTFPTPPPGGTPKNIAVTKRIVRWRDSNILSALQAGARQLFPALWTTVVDTSLSIIQDTYDYTLPPAFADPSARILSVAVQDIPSTIEPFRKVIDYERVGLTTLHIFYPNWFTPGAVLRIEYAGPYQALGDLPEQAVELPILYAAGSLLTYGEARRSEVNTQTVQGPEQALPPGQQQAAGQGFMQQFYAGRAEIARPMKMGRFRSTWVA